MFTLRTANTEIGCLVASTERPVALTEALRLALAVMLILVRVVALAVPIRPVRPMQPREAIAGLLLGRRDAEGLVLSNVRFFSLLYVMLSKGYNCFCLQFLYFAVRLETVFLILRSCTCWKTRFLS